MSYDTTLRITCSTSSTTRTVRVKGTSTRTFALVFLVYFTLFLNRKNASSNVGKIRSTAKEFSVKEVSFPQSIIDIQCLGFDFPFEPGSQSLLSYYFLQEKPESG